MRRGASVSALIWMHLDVFATISIGKFMMFNTGSPLIVFTALPLRGC